MRTSGIDLSADDKKVGVATIEWRGGRAVLVDVRVGADDDALISLIKGSDKTGIDCPLGWPDAFIAFIVAHAAGEPLPGEFMGRWRTALQYRKTDLWLKGQVPGVQGLSVAADRIGSTAMRCAVLLERLQHMPDAGDRKGGGRLVEVYPAASLSAWGLPFSGYKARDKQSVRASILVQLQEGANLDLGPFEGLLHVSDDALDALVCALTARAAALDLCLPVPPDHLAAAKREGWIGLPEGPLSRIVGQQQ